MIGQVTGMTTDTTDRITDMTGLAIADRARIRATIAALTTTVTVRTDPTGIHTMAGPFTTPATGMARHITHIIRR